MWHAKRYLPATYTRAMGLANRLTGTAAPIEIDDRDAHRVPAT